METINLYNCKVLHGGYDIRHEIAKKGISEYELTLLQGMHGAEQVVDVTGAGKKEIDSKKLELFRLARQYTVAGDIEKTKSKFEKFIGEKLIGFEQFMADADEEVESSRPDIEPGKTIEVALDNKGKK